MSHARARLGIMFAAVAVPVVIASAAYACAVLTTLLIEPGKGRPGDAISFTGHNYSLDPTTSNVQVRFNSRSGEVLWEGRPGADRTISGTFGVPDKDPGTYVVMAVQYKADGSAVSGTPGRASLRIQRAAARNSAAAVAAPDAGTGSGPSLAFQPASGRGVDPAIFLLGLGGIGMILGASLYWKLSGRSALAPRAVA